MFIGDESQAVDAGCAIYIPPGATQSIENTGTDDLLFLCIVDPAWQPQDEEILDDE
jgi:mannose-6-phosphate isomerase-like protein (cupin superfamily)